jgi:uncharacterized protein YkwD
LQDFGTDRPTRLSGLRVTLRDRSTGPWARGWMALALASLPACASNVASGPVAAADASGDGSVADPNQPITGPLTAKVQNRAVTLGWDEDEHLYHCLDIEQTLPGKKPAKVSFCPPGPGQHTLTLGGTDDKGHPLPGVDYQWTAVQAFVPGPATWTLRGGEQPTGSKVEVGHGTLRIGPHFDGPCDSEAGHAVGLDEWHAAPPVTLDVTVQVLTPARNEIDITTPGILVDAVTAAGTNSLHFKYTFKNKGMYTVEVNDTGGGAILNCAIYVGADVPLAPVEVHGGQGLMDAPTAAQLATMRQKLLDLTNAERAKVDLAPLSLDDKLNVSAQFHSNDMGKRNYFAHVDPDGKGPGDRALAAGYQGGVGENIASDLSVEGAHNGLYWSAGHRANMLGKGWVHVGFGIAKAATSKNMLVTENFGDQ